jgi:hypothetical protein
MWTVTMDNAERQAWNDLALLTTFMNTAGIQFHPSGFNLFMRQYLAVSSAVLTPLADAPTNAASPAPTFSITATAGANMVITTDSGWCGAKDGRCRFALSAALKPSRYTWSGPWPNSFSTGTATIAAGLPNYVLCPTPDGVAGQRLYLIVKACYTMPVGYTVTWPQFLSLEMI